MHEIKHTTKASVQKGKLTTPAVRGRVWVDGSEGTFLGYGRVVLLERVREYGSITKAAKSMEMSYRHAWDLIDSMNCQAKKPFVEAATGGKGGGGARLTEAGEEAIRLFWAFHADFQVFLKQEQIKLLRKFSTHKKVEKTTKPIFKKK